jgi:hypothetical protein
MGCRQCCSANQGKFGIEMNIHFPGYEGLQKPSLWIFPEVMVCLDCGFAEFTVTEIERHQLAEGKLV